MITEQKARLIIHIYNLDGVYYLNCEDWLKDKKQLTIILDSIKISFLPEIDPEIIKRI